MQATPSIEKLLQFAMANGLLAREDMDFARNALLYAMHMDAPEEGCVPDNSPLPQTATPMLESLCEAAVGKGIIEDFPFFREQFSAHLMNLLTPPPSQIIRKYRALENYQGIQQATEWFHNLCRTNDYIRVDQLARNVEFVSPSPYGQLEITINLSKPEKDPREIARLKDAPSVGYPRCMLCVENEGYAGRPGYPSHETLRTIPLTLEGEAWRFQYSPYAYYHEHCIVLNEDHRPMALSRRTFSLLLDFLDEYHHYFLGSNADLPIVGGSILTHDHFQGGYHTFPMDKAPAYAAFSHAQYPDVRIEAVRWPMTCIRLSSFSKDQLIPLADDILAAWRQYDDPINDILHATGDVPHNTVTPIARRQADGRYVLQLVLRNNRTSPEHPLGIFHPHADLHHIKRENIGLIEVMGLFVLPGRLRDELNALTDYLTGKRPVEKPAEDDPLAKHYAWIEPIAWETGTSHTPEEALGILKQALALKCVRVLEDSGVFKPNANGDAALARFLRSLGIKPA